MSKKIANEKEIEKARLERKWTKVLSLVSALNVKNVGGALNSEEVEISCCFYLGEAELDLTLEQRFKASQPHNSGISEDDLRQAYSYLSAAATAAKKFKDRLPQLHQDSHLLLAKYYFIIGNYKHCVEHVNDLELLNVEILTRRGKYILAEAITCKALSLECLSKDSNEILEAFEMAGEIALSICIDEERPSTLKRSATPTSSSAHSLTPILEACLIRPGELLTSNGLISDAIQNYRMLLRVVETKSTYNVRKVFCRRLAEVLLSCTCMSIYDPPMLYQKFDSKAGSLCMVTPNRNSPDVTSSSSLKIYKRSSTFGEPSFTPADQVEEAVLLLLLSEAMLAKNAVAKQTKDHYTDKQKILNETKVVLDLLVLALTRRDQYNLLSQSHEKIMKLAFDEFHLWFQFGLSLVCAGKYSRALLTFEQCMKLHPENTEVLMLCAKLCINHLKEFKDGIFYAEKVVNIAKDDYVKADGYLALGVCYNYLALTAKSSGEIKDVLFQSQQALNKAHEIDSNDTDILFHLALNQALSKQVQSAIDTIQHSLTIDPTALTSLYLLSLLLSAQKRYHDALEILESAIEEYPEEFGLQLIKVKLTEECHGSQASVVVCHNLLLLWSSICSSTGENNEIDGVTGDVGKSQSFSKSLPLQTLNDSTLKKVSLADSISQDDDGTGSIVASIRLEKARSEAASGMTSIMSSYNISAAIALLAKLWLVTAECFINLGDTTEASGCILEASTIFPLSPDVLYMRGRLNETLNNIKEAKACYESALSILPTHQGAMQKLGLIYHTEGDMVLAEKTLRSCILQDSGNSAAWNDLGLILESSGQHDEAADCFMTSLKLEMNSPILPYTIVPRLFKAFDNT